MDLGRKSVHEMGEGLVLLLIEPEEQRHGRLRSGVRQKVKLKIFGELIEGGDGPWLQAAVPCAGRPP